MGHSRDRKGRCEGRSYHCQDHSEETIEDTQDNLVELFHTLLHKFKRHAFNINQQYSYCRELRKKLSKEEAVIHIDFSENYTCKYSSEIQAVHFGSSHEQATLHTGVLYIGGEKSPFALAQCHPPNTKAPELYGNT